MLVFYVIVSSVIFTEYVPIQHTSLHLKWKLAFSSIICHIYEKKIMLSKIIVFHDWIWKDCGRGKLSSHGFMLDKLLFACG
jgi:hypothetical protein